MPIIWSHDTNESKDVRIRGYFSKLKGVREKKLGNNVLETLREENTQNEKLDLQIHNH